GAAAQDQRDQLRRGAADCSQQHPGRPRAEPPCGDQGSRVTHPVHDRSGAAGAAPGPHVRPGHFIPRPLLVPFIPPSNRSRAKARLPLLLVQKRAPAVSRFVRGLRMIGQDRAVLAATALRYFVAFAVAAMGLRSARPGWLRTLGLSTAGAGLAAAPLIIPGAPFYGSILRDWWPLLLVPVAYRAPAGLAGAPRILLERRLLRVDERLAGLTRATGTPRIPVLDDLLEVAYLLVYPLVPAGLLAFSWSGEASAGDGFWPVLWWAVLPCYASLPVLPTRAPRELAP